MQATHEDEITILNEIDKLAIGHERGTVKLEELEVKLDEYLAHVKAHFSNEERLMVKYDFPAYEMHKMAHDMFLIDLNYATKQWKEFGDLHKILGFIRKSPEWIVLHINTMDTATATYIAQKMALETENA
jgi:hemerythrin